MSLFIIDIHKGLLLSEKITGLGIWRGHKFIQHTVKQHKE